METDSKFLYPADLVSLCRTAWQRQQELRTPKTKSRRKDQDVLSGCPPFPTDGELLELLSTVYHVSFLAEEGRPVSVRVIYVLPETFERCHNLNLHEKPARLQRTVQLSVGELLKLAPAVQPIESAIMVAPADAANSEATGSLVIWGVLHLGTEWWKIITGADSAAMCPPNCLTISSFAPGALTISALGDAIARLRNGRLIGTPLPDLDEGPIGDFLAPAARELYRAAAAALGRERYDDEKDSDRHPFQLYHRTLARLLHLVREQGHGGTLLILPDEITPVDGRLVDRLTIKYGLEIESIWETLVQQCVAQSNYYRLLFPNSGTFTTFPQQASASAKSLKELIRWEGLLEAADNRIAEYCSTIAALSAVDGAVVLSRRLRLYGFGAEILATSPSLSEIKDAYDPNVTQAATARLERYGTRHRSAMRMCSSFEECVALVVSQDGPVKAIKRVGADVVMWNDVTLGRQAI